MILKLKEKFECGCVVYNHSKKDVPLRIDYCKVHGYFYDRIFDMASEQAISGILGKYGLPLDDIDLMNADNKENRAVNKEDNKVVSGLIVALLERPEVDDILPLLKNAPAMEIADGRLLLPLNIYLTRPAPEGGSLGLAVEDGIGVEDVFGGA